jgi:hypothetical protein
MCTIGAVSNINAKGERLGFLMKTLDSPLGIEMFHGYFRAANMNQAIFTSLMRQQGMNIGMNQQRIAVTISYSDCLSYTGEKEPRKLDTDTRALANAEILARCKSVDEGIEILKDFVPRYPDQVGGNYLLIDANGEIALLEQWKGKYEYRKFTDRGYCGRGNNSHWLIKDKQVNLYPPADSSPREEAMENFIKGVHENIPQGMNSREIVNNAKALLSRHSESDDQIGGICIHGLVAPGARVFGDAPCYTLGAVILDLKELVMHYSLDNPCSGSWKSLKLEVSN